MQHSLSTCSCNDINELCNMCRAYEAKFKVVQSEYLLKQVFDQNAKYKYFTHNKSTHSETSKRPDFKFNLNNSFLYVENDEKQHKSYGLKNEIEKMKEIMALDHENKPVVFIRFNPDKLKCKRRLVEKFNTTKRIMVLMNCIDYFKKKDFENDFPFDLQVVYLFYDEFDITNVPIYHIGFRGVLRKSHITIPLDHYRNDILYDWALNVNIRSAKTSDFESYSKSLYNLFTNPQNFPKLLCNGNAYVEPQNECASEIVTL